jgi:hypothetical protein
MDAHGLKPWHAPALTCSPNLNTRVNPAQSDRLNAGEESRNNPTAAPSPALRIWVHSAERGSKGARRHCGHCRRFETRSDQPGSCRPSPNSPIRARQRRTRIEGSSPTPGTLSSVKTRAQWPEWPSCPPRQTVRSGRAAPNADRTVSSPATKTSPAVLDPQITSTSIVRNTAKPPAPCPIPGASHRARIECPSDDRSRPCCGQSRGMSERVQLADWTHSYESPSRPNPTSAPHGRIPYS